MSEVVFGTFSGTISTRACWIRADAADPCSPTSTCDGGGVSRRNEGLSLVDEIRQTEDRLRIYEALTQALSEPHAVLDVLLHADDTVAAVGALRERFGFDEIQATAVTELQFRRVTPAEQGKIRDGRDELRERLSYLQGLDESH